MENEIVTKDLSQFGFIELKEAGLLLTEYTNTHNQLELGNGLAVWFNRNSGNVFLCDEDYNVAMLDDDGELKMFYTCSECGNEGFDVEFKDQDCRCCKNIYKDLTNDC